MKLLRAARLTALVFALGLGAGALPAQETNQIEQLKQQLEQMQSNFDRVVREQKQQIDALTQKLEELSRQQQSAAAKTNVAPAVATAPAAAVTPEQVEELNKKVDSVVEAQKKVRPSEFNPSIGLVGETLFSYRTKSSVETGSDRPGGFDVFQRSVELNLAASADPFAKGYAVINATADSATGVANAVVEEAAIQTTSLPWNLELKAGRFFGEFGRLADIHDHELPFVNRPLALDRYIGGESMTDGLQFNWLLPVPHYVSLTFGLGDQFGEDSPNPNDPGATRHFSAVNYFGRLSTYFDLTPDWQLETGVSGLINPSTQDRGGVITNSVTNMALTEKERRLAGLDVKLSYVPLRNNQFRSFTWGTEVLYSDNRYLFNPGGIPDNDEAFYGNVGSLGLYSYVTYKWHRQWSAGFLFDWVQNAQNRSDETFAYSPYLTWALSHWNQLRLQYTHTDPSAVSGLRPDDAIYLQWAWIIGSHAHGWQQR
jgi:uncharacterized coiled-coil protein SlyX